MTLFGGGQDRRCPDEAVEATVPAAAAVLDGQDMDARRYLEKSRFSLEISREVTKVWTRESTSRDMTISRTRGEAISVWVEPLRRADPYR